MTDSLAELQRLATEATPGPWHIGGGNLLPANEARVLRGPDGEYIARVNGLQQWRANIGLMAAANPALILRLVRIAQAAETVCVANAAHESGDSYWHALYGALAALREALGEKQP